MRNLAAKRSCHWLKTHLFIKFLLLAFKVAGGVMVLYPEEIPRPWPLVTVLSILLLMICFVLMNVENVFFKIE